MHCPAPTRADDVALLSSSTLDLQLQISMAAEYGSMEHYELQPSNSMILPIATKMPIEALKKTSQWHINDEKIEVLEKATHLGIQLDSATAGGESTISHNM